MNYKVITLVRNVEHPSSDCFRFICSISGLEQARSFFSLKGSFICPDDLKSFLSPRQFRRFKSFLNKPRRYNLFILDVVSYRVLP